ncbi:MAG TPA: GNAT family protein [Solirubrobacteraceae bacterium]|nr:GNAT family protein [Solirubrobacteraceae bacterium]
MGSPADITLRPVRPDDLPLLTGGESPFDEFGPATPRTSPPAARLDDTGVLAVIGGDGALAGEVSWHYVHWGPTRGSWCPMIGIWLRPAARGHGIGRAAQRALADLFFVHTTVNRVEAHTDVENVAEQRALEAAGFTREGRIRGAQWRGGAYRDGYLYAILRADADGGTMSS